MGLFLFAERTFYDVGGVPMKSRFPISTPRWRMMS
jgi:hypothetical protein